VKARVSSDPEVGKLTKHLTHADGFEGMADVFDIRKALSVGPDEGHDVETAALLEEIVFFKETERGKGQSALFFRGHGLSRLSLPACFHLDEDESVAVAGDEVDFSPGGPVAAYQDPKALASEVASGFALAFTSE